MWGWWGTGTGGPEKLWMPHPHSRTGWMEIWVTQSSERWTCLWPFCDSVIFLKKCTASWGPAPLSALSGTRLGQESCPWVSNCQQHWDEGAEISLKESLCRCCFATLGSHWLSSSLPQPRKTQSSAANKSVATKISPRLFSNEHFSVCSAGEYRLLPSLGSDLPHLYPQASGQMLWQNTAFYTHLAQVVVGRKGDASPGFSSLLTREAREKENCRSSLRKPNHWFSLKMLKKRWFCRFEGEDGRSISVSLQCLCWDHL